MAKRTESEEQVKKDTEATQIKEDNMSQYNENSENTVEIEGLTLNRQPAYSTESMAELRQWIQSNANVHIQDMFNRTPLFFALNADQARYLVSSGMDINYMDTDRRTAIFYAQTPNLIKILVKLGAKLNIKDSFGRTPIFYAQTAEATKAFVDCGADVNVVDAYSCLTPLHCARTPEQAMVLIEAGADVNAENDLGEKPIDFIQNKQIKDVLQKNANREPKKHAKQSNSVLGKLGTLIGKSR